MTADFRCSSHLHAKLTDEGRLEVKCDRRGCGARKGVVVFHYFNAETGNLIDTVSFADPAKLVQPVQHVRRSA